MSEGRRSRAWGAAWLFGLLLAWGCASSDLAPDEFPPPIDYVLGGQTGSLIPGCGVAPLSAAGRSVPAGDALAVLYAGDCPEQVEDQLALSGTNMVRVDLVPLADGVFLVVADQSLAEGEYQLAVGDEAAGAASVSAAVEVPRSLGALRWLPPDDACADDLRFELALDTAALAYAPLSRFQVSVDGGSEQLWVDYGALPIESGPDGSRGLLDLPRCGANGCLSRGLHRLQLRADIAGEALRPDPIEVEFEVGCSATDGSSPVASDSAGGVSCSLGAAPSSSIHGALASACMLLAAALLRRRPSPLSRA